jgi:hypothetical protein
MQITLNLDDDLGHALLNLPNPEQFAQEVLQKALKNSTPLASSEKSHWAKVMDEIEANPINLGDYAETLKQDMREVRQGFVFKHDGKL